MGVIALLVRTDVRRRGAVWSLIPALLLLTALAAVTAIAVGVGEIAVRAQQQHHRPLDLLRTE